MNGSSSLTADSATEPQDRQNLSFTGLIALQLSHRFSSLTGQSGASQEQQNTAGCWSGSGCSCWAWQVGQVITQLDFD